MSYTDHLHQWVLEIEPTDRLLSENKTETNGTKQTSAVFIL